jgi:uncharacterized protein
MSNQPAVPVDTSTIRQIILRHYPTVQGIYRFGSYGTQYARPDSDVDIALLLPPDQARLEGDLTISQCRFDLEEALSREVDLLNARRVSTVFQIQITRGDLIYCGDRYAVDEFEMLALSYYQKLNEERRGILEDFYKTGRAYPV